MTTITNENISAFSAGEVPQSNDEKNDLDYLKAMKNHSMMGGAMVTMEEMMLMFTELAQGKFKQMQDKTAVGRDATDLANRVEGIVAKLASGDDLGELTQDVIDYMKKNNILIGGKSIDDFLEGVGYTQAEWHYQYWKDEKNLAPEHKGDTARIEKEKKSYAAQVKKEGGDPENIVKKMSKSQLEEVKNALESTATRATDFVQSSQLKLQQLMQSFNTAVAMANAVQSMNGESTKSIAQSIR
jgi:secreted effector protein SseB